MVVQEAAGPPRRRRPCQASLSRGAGLPGSCLVETATHAMHASTHATRGRRSGPGGVGPIRARAAAITFRFAHWRTGGMHAWMDGARGRPAVTWEVGAATAT
jgi:hypothetical protein